jgi:hypothetical protein
MPMLHDLHGGWDPIPELGHILRRCGRAAPTHVLDDGTGEHFSERTGSLALAAKADR